MTLPQILSFAIVAGMMALFVWGRIRYDLVAALALLAAVAAGIVPADKAFEGFSDDIVVIVGSALVVSAAVARSGVMEALIGALARRVPTTQLQITALVLTVTLLSSFVKNIGALAMMIPVAFQVARRNRISPACFLMPMAFGSLLGGLVTLVGTSPNIIVSRVRQEMTGEPFAMFDFAPVGLGLALAGVAFLAVGYRLLPAERKGTASLDAAVDIKNYVTEVTVPSSSPAAGETVSGLRHLGDDEVAVTAIIRDGDRRSTPLPDARLRPGDTLLLEGDPEALERVVASAKLKMDREDHAIATQEPTDDVSAVEAVVGPGSPLAGRTPVDLQLYQRHGLNLIAVSRAGERITERLRDFRLRAGDVVVLQGTQSAMPATLKELRCLPLAERDIALGSGRRGYVPVLVLAAAMVLVALKVVPVAMAFFGAAILVVLLGSLPLRDAYDSVEWPILVMLGALIPVSEAVRTTGGTDLIAGWLSAFGSGLPGYGALALIMVAAMAVTPFLNNAATVLVMAPIAASFAGQLGYRPDAFLMAVAVGAACDFLTPIGHQCNTLVMGPGGYRFGDYWRLGLPLSALVVALGVPLIMLVWPLAG